MPRKSNSNQVLVPITSVIEAVDDITTGLHCKHRIAGDMIEVSFPDAQCHMILHAENPIERFRCDCGHQDEPCKHFIITMLLVRKILNIPEPLSHTEGRLERRLKRSKSISKASKSSLKAFTSDYQKLVSAEPLADENFRYQFATIRCYSDTRDLLEKSIYQMLDDGDPVKAAENQCFLLFSVYNTISQYGDPIGIMQMLERDTNIIWRRMVRKSKAAEKLRLWELCMEALDAEDREDLPDFPIVYLFTGIARENFTQKKYLKELLDLADRMIDLAGDWDYEDLQSHWVCQKIRIMDDLGADNSEIYDFALMFWHYGAVRLTYLDFCVEYGSFREALNIAKDCLDFDFKDEINAAYVHRVLMACYYELDMFDDTVKEARWILDHEAYELLWMTEDFLKSDRARWAKVKKKLQPLIDKSRKAAFNISR